MIISCLQEELNKGLTTVSRAVSLRSTLPITQNILISTNQSKLKLVATNLEMLISCSVNAKVEGEFSIAMPSKLLTEFISSLPNERVDMSVDKHTMELKCSSFEARIKGLDSKDFPPIPQISDEITKVRAQDLKEGISQVSFAASTDTSRPVLSGVQLNFEEDKLTLAAADGFRLAVHTTTLSDPIKDKVSLIVPARALDELERILTNPEEEVDILVNPQKSQILFRLKNVELVSMVLPGEFPKYQSMIPSSHKTRIVVESNKFLRAIRTSSLFSKDSSNIVRIVSSDNEITISATAEEIGDNVGRVNALVEGESIKAAFNAKYLAEASSVISQEKIDLRFTSTTSPCAIRPLESDKYVCVVMPINVIW